MRKTMFVCLVLLALFVTGCGNHGEATIRVVNDTEVTFNKYCETDGANGITREQGIDLKPGQTFERVFAIPRDRAVGFVFLTDTYNEGRRKDLDGCSAGKVYEFTLSSFHKAHIWLY